MSHSTKPSRPPGGGPCRSRGGISPGRHGHASRSARAKPGDCPRIPGAGRKGAGFVNPTQVIRTDSHATAAIRPVHPADLPALGGFFEDLSVESRYLRFFAPVRPTGSLLHLLSGGPANVDAVVAVADGVIVGHAMAT